MADFPHMDWYPRDYIADTRHLTPEQRGCYSDLLSYAWLNGAQLPDDDAKLARMCGVTQSRFRSKIRPALAEFWAIENGLWIQKRQQKEFMLVEQKVGKLRANASRGGKAKALNQKKTVLADASQMLAENPSKTVPITEAESYTERKKEPPHTPPPEVGAVETVKPTRSKSKRGTRLPDGWVPSGKNIEDAINSGIPPQAIDDMGAQFRDYWVAVPGQRGTKLDWDATWRNRCKDQAPKYRGLVRPKRRNILDEMEAEKGVMGDAKRILHARGAARDRGDYPPLDIDGQTERAEGKPGGGSVAVLPDGREVPLHGTAPNGRPVDCGQPVVPIGGEGSRGRAKGSAGPCDSADRKQERSVGQDPCVVAEGVERALGEIVRGTTSRPHDHRRGVWVEPASPDGPSNPSDEHGPR